MATGFPDTPGTLIERLRHSDEAISAVALEKLWKIYHPHMKAVLRAWNPQGIDPDDAFQNFCERAHRYQLFQRFDPKLGRLRNFLLGSLKLSLRRDLRSEKSRPIASADPFESELLTSGMDPVAEYNNLDPVFDKEWAKAEATRALVSLRESFRKRGKEKYFEALSRLAWGGGATTQSYDTVAREFGKNDGAVRTAVSRLRGLTSRNSVGRLAPLCHPAVMSPKKFDICSKFSRSKIQPIVEL